MADLPPPPDVPCAGCDELTPYDAGPGDEHPSYGEYLNTPLGMTYIRTCRRRECVETARARRRGSKRRTLPVRDQLAAQREGRTDAP